MPNLRRIPETLRFFFNFAEKIYRLPLDSDNRHEFPLFCFSRYITSVELQCEILRIPLHTKERFAA